MTLSPKEAKSCYPMNVNCVEHAERTEAGRVVLRGEGYEWPLVICGRQKQPSWQSLGGASHSFTSECSRYGTALRRIFAFVFRKYIKARGAC
jgi:hypothetical protein